MGIPGARVHVIADTESTAYGIVISTKENRSTSLD